MQMTFQIAPNEAKWRSEKSQQEAEQGAEEAKKNLNIMNTITNYKGRANKQWGEGKEGEGENTDHLQRSFFRW